MISAAKNSNKFPKKTRFWKEKSVVEEDVVTLGPTGTDHTSENKPRLNKLYSISTTHPKLIK